MGKTETVTVADLSDREVADAVNRLADLQTAKAVIEREEKGLRETVKTYLGANELDKFSTPEGHGATIFTTTRINADREVAEKILSAEQFSEIFKPLVVNTLRIK